MALQLVGLRTYVETEYNGANVSCVVTPKGLVLIDTPYIPQEVAHWQAQLKRLSSLPVAYIINTDHHFDHVLGNHALGGLVIAHELAYEKMTTPRGTLRETFLPFMRQNLGPAADEILRLPLVPPQLTFSDGLTLRLGDATLELMSYGGHTDATIMAYLVEDKILFSGDNVETNRHPYKGEACFADWIEALRQVQELDIDVIVPGHGEVTHKAEASRMLVYFRQQWDLAAKVVRQGKNREEVVRECHRLLNFYPLEPGTEETASQSFDAGIGRLYDEIAGY